jgi:hypothetical protein
MRTQVQIQMKVPQLIDPEKLVPEFDHSGKRLAIDLPGERIDGLDRLGNLLVVRTAGGPLRVIGTAERLERPIAWTDAEGTKIIAKVI